MNFVNLFVKYENHNKSRFYKQILKVGTPTFRKFFLIFNHRTNVNVFFLFRKNLKTKILKSNF
ncbi:hypothetical protein BUQ74_05255 [Leptospira weilii serovar Heyan]|nr:hypothetical protein BUQ74_05255 [Leptospira weilii serovar Heyan]